MGNQRVRQWLLERRTLRSTITAWICQLLGLPEEGWEVAATRATIAEVRRDRVVAAETDEGPQGFLLSGATYRVRRRDIKAQPKAL